MMLHNREAYEGIPSMNIRNASRCGGRMAAAPCVSDSCPGSLRASSRSRYFSIATSSGGGAPLRPDDTRGFVWVVHTTLSTPCGSSLLVTPTCGCGGCDCVVLLPLNNRPENSAVDKPGWLPDVCGRELTGVSFVGVNSGSFRRLYTGKEVRGEVTCWCGR